MVGVEVEIRSQARLSISPRDVQLRSGGIYFHADPGSQLHRNCSPRLPRSLVKKDTTSTGFVLFDVPLPEPPDLEVLYQPTRFGGASPARVRVGKWR
jgi:hypothetical protein